MPLNKNPNEEMTLPQKLELFQLLAYFPAMTLMVFTRRRIGFRMLRPAWIIVMACILIAWGSVAPGLSGGKNLDGPLIFLYAAALLTVGLAQRWSRWREIIAGKRWYSYSTGVPYMESLPLPPYFMVLNRVQRYLEPITGYLIGLAVWLVASHGLGVWIMVSALAMTVFEQSRFEKQLDRDLDVIDGILVSEIQAELVERSDSSEALSSSVGSSALSLEQTAGLAVGLDQDLQRQIAKRRRRTATAAVSTAQDGVIA